MRKYVPRLKGKDSYDEWRNRDSQHRHGSDKENQVEKSRAKKDHIGNLIIIK